ncbi:unnamed protein product [Brassica oleracea]
MIADEIAKLFPGLYGQPSVSVVPDQSAASSGQKLKIGVVLSGGQAPGGHNVISGLLGACSSTGLEPSYLGGFDMICSGRDKIETPEQFKQAEETAKKLDLDGLVVIGGDDSNTNACLLAENFRSKNLKTRVIGCPKTIDGDLKCKEVPTSFGFDTACKIYSEMIGNVMIDARSTGKYYHFVRLMGRAASHITLECALQTHPNIIIIGEEVSAQKQTLKNVTDYMVDVICKRTELGYNYGVILIPEGLIDFIPEVQELIAELNEILANEVVDDNGLWKKKLTEQSLKLFDLLPEAIQEQLMLERDPHGNVQVAKIETEKMLIQMVETELEKRKLAGSYKRQFMRQSHFFGYEGRCGLPTNFDATYCYALGYGAGVLLNSGKTGLISSVSTPPFSFKFSFPSSSYVYVNLLAQVGNLAAPVEEWTVGGTALTALMDVERRHGKFKPVIKKAMVELEGARFKKFASLREEWALKNRYISPVNYPKTTTWTITRRLVITVLDTMTRKLQLHPVSRHGVVWLPWKLVIFLYVALSLLSLLSIHLQYYSVTMLEPLSVAGSHIPPRKYPGDRPKVAFLFLTRRDLPLDFMWDRFFKGADQANFSVYIHSQPGFVFNEETTRSHYFYNRQLNNSINVIWGEYSMIEAERLLLSTAIDDHSNQRFVLLSDSCAPLYDFGYIYQYLISSPRSFVDSFINTKERRYSMNMSSVIPEEKWRKGSQWISVIRSHAELIVNDGIVFSAFEKFCKKAPPFGSQEAQLFFNLRNCIPDEHYIQTLLTMRGLESEMEPRTLTYTVWNVSGTKHGAKSWHPVTFTFENSGPEDIQEIKSINHVNYESESRTEWCTADSKHVPCFLFARKFTKEAAMRLVSEVLIGSSKNVAL